MNTWRSQRGPHISETLECFEKCLLFSLWHRYLCVAKHKDHTFEDHGKDKGHFPQWRTWFENIKSSGGSLKEPDPRLPTLRDKLSRESSGGEAVCCYTWFFFFQCKSWCNRRWNPPDFSFTTGDRVGTYTVVKISPRGPESWAWDRSICLSTSVFWNRIFV